jgi:hypothetical protein
MSATGPVGTSSNPIIASARRLVIGEKVSNTTLWFAEHDTTAVSTGPSSSSTSAPAAPTGTNNPATIVPMPRHLINLLITHLLLVFGERLSAIHHDEEARLRFGCSQANVALRDARPC